MECRPESPGGPTVVVCLSSDCLGLEAGAAKNKGRALLLSSADPHTAGCAHARLGAGNMTWRRKKEDNDGSGSPASPTPRNVAWRWALAVVLRSRGIGREAGGGKLSGRAAGRQGVNSQAQRCSGPGLQCCGDRAVDWLRVQQQGRLQPAEQPTRSGAGVG